VGQTELLTGERRGEHALVVNGDDRVERRAVVVRDDGRGGLLRAAQRHGQRPVPHDRGQRLATV
jgi:hypothetical protein